MAHGKAARGHPVGVHTLRLIGDLGVSYRRPPATVQNPDQRVGDKPSGWIPRLPEARARRQPMTVQNGTKE
jgi:hypothetical protein